MKLRAPGPKPKLIKPVRASAAQEAWLRKQMQSMLKAMHDSVMYWVKASWRKTGLPETDADMAKDRMPARELQEAIDKLMEQWQGKFIDMSHKISKGFADKTLRHTDNAFKQALREAGMSVRFQTTQAIRDALEAQMMDNVNLIKSIPQKYLGDVHGKIMRSVSEGRSMKELTKDLQESYGVSHRRAAFIARDQNNKATAIIHKTRQDEVGITTARWIHTSASKHPRPEHQKWGSDRATYDINKGMWSEAVGKYIWPGTEPNCGCTSMSVVPGLEDDD